MRRLFVSLLVFILLIAIDQIDCKDLSQDEHVVLETGPSGDDQDDRESESAAACEAQTQINESQNPEEEPGEGSSMLEHQDVSTEPDILNDESEKRNEWTSDAPDEAFDEATSDTHVNHGHVEVLLLEDSSVISNPLVLDLTVDVLSDVASYRRLFESDAERSLLLALIHDASCSHSNDMLDHFQQAAELTKELKNVKLGTLQLDESTVLRDYGIDKFPTLLFVTSAENSTLLLEYSGLQDLPEDIASTTRHYYHRLVLATSGLELSEEMAHVLPPVYDSLQHLREFLAAHNILPLERQIPHPLPPTVSSAERVYIQFMLSEERKSEITLSGDAESRYALPDDSVLFLQCRLGESKQTESYMLFDQMSRAISNRRDRFFAIVRECDQSNNVEDGHVLVWSIPYDFNFQTQDFTTELDVQYVIRDNLVAHITKWARPSILWFDRQTTAPIVFGFDQKLHAVLVIDTHHSSRNLTNVEPFLLTRAMLRYFRRACREHKEWACLIVPSTETRVLITLGVDIWTPLDRQAFDGIPVDRDNLLPVVVLTDQRTKGKTFTHFLSHDAMQKHSGMAIANFFADVEFNGLQPRVKSDRRGPRTNSAGVRILTADSLEELDHTPNALIMFIAPTCGHCKRANVIWNRLSEFLISLQWNFVALFRLDVSENEVPTAIAPKWLPDIYYYANHEYLRFDWADKSELDGMDILEWFLAAANLPNSNMSALLNELEQKV